MQAGPRRGKGGARGKAAEPAGPLALFGWVLFDWATQPFYTLVVTFLFGPYFVNGFIGDPALGATLWAYATGGADWYPDHLSFMFSRRNPARTALLTAHWEPPEKLKELIAPRGCGYHYTHALDLFRFSDGGQAQVSSLTDSLGPLSLYRLDHGDPPFLKQGGRA